MLRSSVLGGYHVIRNEAGLLFCRTRFGVRLWWALPTETKLESGTSQSKGGTSFYLWYSGKLKGTQGGNGALGGKTSPCRVTHAGSRQKDSEKQVARVQARDLYSSVYFMCRFNSRKT